MNQPKKSSQPRYQKVRELGRTENGDRITYLAKDNATGRSVAIKQYSFGKGNENWAGMQAYADQCRALTRLDSPSLPRYLNFLPVKDGFCTVRDYQQGRSLAELGKIEIEQWKQIAIALLEALVYLQSQTPSLIHRNIKPENVFVDDAFNVRLVDFGFAFIDSRGKERPATAGTPGFMPREQLQNKELNDASDLYGLGATLICLLTQTPSAEINKFLGDKSDLDLRTVLPKEVSFELLDWLEKMTQVSPVRRFKSAALALEDLQSIEIARSPQAILDRDLVELIAREYGEKLITTITVRNTVPDTLLQGRWEVAEHPSDSKTRSPQWIAFQPKQFESNKIDCNIAIDTRKLLAEQTYERELLLHSNDAASPHRIPLQVVTPAFQTDKIPLLWLLGVFALAVFGGFLGSLLLNGEGEGMGAIYYGTLLLGLILGAIGGLTGAFELWAISGATFPLSFGLTRFLIPRLFRGLLRIGYFVGFAAFWSAGYVARHNFSKKLPHGSEGLLTFNVLLASLIASFGIALGLVVHGGLLNFLLLLGTGIASGVLLSLAYSKAAQRLAQYRKAKPSLLKP